MDTYAYGNEMADNRAGFADGLKEEYKCTISTEFHLSHCTKRLIHNAFRLYVPIIIVQLTV